jgi:hypothetical protein
LYAEGGRKARVAVEHLDPDLLGDPAGLGAAIIAQRQTPDAADASRGAGT